MEDSTSSSTKEVTPPVNYPGSFHEVIRAILKCLGLETEFQQIPTSCSTKEDDAKLNHNQLHSPKQTSDPPTTVTDPPPNPPSTTGDDGGSDRGFPVISLSAPKRPGTGRGRGGQIN